MFDSLQVSTKRNAPLNADTTGLGAGEQVKQPAFITTASLATFAGGSAVITILWKVAIAIFDWNGRWFPAVVALALGIFFFWQAMEDGKLKGSAVMGAAIVALVNACVLWSSAVGIDSAT
jgi:hypothetical protein